MLIDGKSITIDASNLSSGITIDAGGGTDGVVGNGDGTRIFDITDPTFGSSPPQVTMIGLTLTARILSTSAVRFIRRDCLRSKIARSNRGTAGP